MARSLPSSRQEQRVLIREMRANNRTWVEIAQELAQRYGVNRRVALRLAHGWSQRETAERWTDHWPAEAKNDKQISAWEQWPARSGHSPSLDVLSKLAELYECGVADLLADAGEYGDRDTAARTRTSGPATPAALVALARRLDEVGVEEAARLVTASGLAITRRQLLLASAALSLAAADPVVSGSPTPAPAAAGPSPLAGIWRSRYVFPSTGRGGDFAGEHYVLLRQQNDKITGQSLPHSTGSRLLLDLTVRASVATGTWTERTSPTGHYKGAIYHGTIQMIVNPMGREMSGRWLGFGKDFTVNSGAWTLSWVNGATSARAAREYHLKV